MMMSFLPAWPRIYPWPAAALALAAVAITPGLACASSTSVCSAPRAEAGALPADAGQVNVRDFGAVGNGRADDTQAILRAIAATPTGADRERMVYLPAGTYRVSETLLKRLNGRFTNGLSLRGEGERATVIRLEDHAPSFGDPKHPKAVIFTASTLYNQGTPTSGGKDWLGKGEGNEAFRNFVSDLSVEIGTGNPGAIGIDYLANNIGAIRDVQITAAPGSGETGIAMTRRWPGPALLSHVSIQGFDHAIAVAGAEYGVTIDGLCIKGQRSAGITNTGNVLSIRGLRSENSAPALVNAAPGGLVALRDAHLDGGAGGHYAIENSGAIDLADVAASGYHAVIAARAGAMRISSYAASDATHSLAATGPIIAAAEEPPARLIEPVSAWANVRQFGAKGDGRSDDTAALQRALSSAARTVYLPFGDYRIDPPLSVGPHVQRIVGMMSYIVNSNASAAPEPSFLIAAPGGPLSIENLRLRSAGSKPPADSIVLRSPRTVQLRDIQFDGAIRRGPTGGSLFLEDVCCGLLAVDGRAPVNAAQFNSEGSGIRIVNRGAPLTILGIKTEGANTVLMQSGQARSEIVGGLIYPVQPVPPSLPLLRVTGGRLQATFAESVYAPSSAYTILLTALVDRRDDKELMRVQPPRGEGRVIVGSLYPK